MKHEAIFLGVWVASIGLLGCQRTESANIVPKQLEAVRWTASGTVVLPNGELAKDFQVAKAWSANGRLWDDSGNTDQKMSEDAIAEFWKNEGEMEPYPENRGGGVISNSGEFSIENPYDHPCIAFAMTKDRRLGGIDKIDRQSDRSLEIVLQPVVRVFGKIRCNQKVPEWTNVYVFYPDGITEAPD